MSDFDTFLQTAADSAREAGRRALELQGTLGPARLKGDKDLVTEADLECDGLIRARLEAAFPAHTLVTEEGETLEKGGEYRWYVDPIDGTINYAHGIPLWGVSIGLTRGGELLCGAVYLPVLDEMYTAVAGGGAFLNGSPLRVSSCERPAEAIVSHGDFNVGAEGADRRRMNAENFWGRMRVADSVQRIKCLGSAAAEGAFVAAGRLDGYWMLTLHPWDVAVSVLLVREAGGQVTDLRGQPWTLEKRSALFSNGRLHPFLLDALDWDRRQVMV